MIEEKREKTDNDSVVYSSTQGSFYEKKVGQKEAKVIDYLLFFLKHDQEEKYCETTSLHKCLYDYFLTGNEKPRQSLNEKERKIYEMIVERMNSLSSIRSDQIHKFFVNKIVWQLKKHLFEKTSKRVSKLKQMPERIGFE